MCHIHIYFSRSIVLSLHIHFILFYFNGLHLVFFFLDSIQLFVSGCCHCYCCCCCCYCYCCFVNFPLSVRGKIYGKSERFIGFRAMGLFITFVFTSFFLFLCSSLLWFFFLACFPQCVLRACTVHIYSFLDVVCVFIIMFVVF